MDSRHSGELTPLIQRFHAVNHRVHCSLTVCSSTIMNKDTFNARRRALVMLDMIHLIIVLKDASLLA